MEGLKAGIKVKVINEKRTEYNEVGTIIRIAYNRITKFYVVNFIGKRCVYFEENELIPFNE